MTLHDDTVVTGAHPQVLLSISHSATTLAIWRRRHTIALKEAASLDDGHVFEALFPLNPNCAESAQKFKGELNRAAGHNCTAIANDLIELSQLYSQISHVNNVCIRIESMKGDGCRWFHLDNVPMRLVVTYAGPGTQWVPHAYAAMACAQQADYAGPLNSITTGDVAFFRGKKSGADDLVFHRSPPMTSSDEVRFVAVIDGVYD